MDYETNASEKTEWGMIGTMLPFDCRLGREIYSCPVAPSTQIAAKDGGAGSAEHGTIWITDHQIAGRGRRDRTWSSAPGLDLTFSVLVRPKKIRAASAPLIGLAAALSVAEAVGETNSELPRPMIKWPNDVLFGEKKFCGVISEAATIGSSVLYAAVGIGVNVNSTEDDLPEPDSPDRPRPTSMLIESRGVGGLACRYGRPALLAAILARFDRYLVDIESGGDAFFPAYGDLCSTIGRAVRLITDEGERIVEVEGVDRDGSLAVIEADGTLDYITAADVVHIRHEAE